MELNNFNLDISSYSNNDLLNLFSMNDIINTLHDKKSFCRNLRPLASLYETTPSWTM